MPLLSLSAATFFWRSALVRLFSFASSLCEDLIFAQTLDEGRIKTDAKMRGAFLLKHVSGEN